MIDICIERGVITRFTGSLSHHYLRLKCPISVGGYNY